MNENTYWQRKIAAFLHDPPEKALDIAHHEAVAASHQTAAGKLSTNEEERRPLLDSVKPCDVFDAAIERFGLPKGKCSHDFADDPRFIHPLSGEAFAFPAGFGDRKGEVADILGTAAQYTGTDDPHSIFFLLWRRWQENAASSRREGRANDAAATAFLPADSRIPDHSIWSHMAMTSAFVDCVRPGGKGDMELLLFQFGPVQDFIAAARTKRDLWSGSYLLSWLAAHALKAVTDETGPDSIVFPSLRGNGIFDALHIREFYNARFADGGHGEAVSMWERIMREKGNGLASWLLTPSLPNRFLAVVPRGRGEELARKADSALRSELASIGDAVWSWLATQGGKADWRQRFESQLAAFPEVTWAVQPWLSRQDILAEAKTWNLPGLECVETTLRFAEQAIPVEDRDTRYYSTDLSTLSSDGIFWSLHVELLEAKLAARRNTRDFAAWSGATAPKDSLTGKEECIGDEAFYKNLRANANTKRFFPKSHVYGAPMLVKRLWCAPELGISYLPDHIEVKDGRVAKELRGISPDELAEAFDDPYIAVLAMDGDEMGKWLSGENLGNLVGHLSPKARDYIASLPGGGNLPRLLTPSYHQQFSEALSNFAIHEAGSVVEGFGGTLVYAGGDDVLAILPARNATACAEALRNAFRQDFDAEHGRLLPGSRADVSCGIAVAHVKSPLQGTVAEARRQESIAKTKYGRGAFAVAVLKRSGEILEWGGKWTSPALPLLKILAEQRERWEVSTGAAGLSARFPYTLAGLLAPYALTGPNAAMHPVIRAEVLHALERQGHDLPGGLATAIYQWLEATADHLENFIAPFLTEAFIDRNRSSED